MSDDLRERLAALEHEQWTHWTSYMLDMLVPIVLIDEGLLMSWERALAMSWSGRQRALAAVARWKRQVVTAYKDLTEEEKESDREWADKVLALVDKERPELKIVERGIRPANIVR